MQRWQVTLPSEIHEITKEIPEKCTSLPRSYRVESFGISVYCHRRLFTASTRADNGVEPLVSSCSRNEAFCSPSRHHGVLSPRGGNKKKKKKQWIVQVFTPRLSISQRSQRAR